jgi:hypothetical protein
LKDSGISLLICEMGKVVVEVLSGPNSAIVCVGFWSETEEE